MRAILLLALALAQPASARSVRLLYVEAPESAPAALFVVVGKEVSRVDLPRLAISSGKAEVPDSAVRLRLAERAPSREYPLPADAPAVDLPPGSGDVLLVLLPSGQPGSLGLRAQPVDFSPARLPDGGVLWLNLSSRVLDARLGSAGARVPPGQVRPMVPGAAPGAAYPVLVDLAPSEPGVEPTPLVRSTWLRDPGRRQLLFVLDDPGRAVPRVVAVPHRPPPPPEPPTPRPPR